nr:RNA-directed DNA polymerase, eukaryota [Tanacetum cinerariifolium]
ADVYIAKKLSKVGRRFAFVRFLRVSNNESLINDLNTIWIGSYHLYAAMARFDKHQKTSSKQNPNNPKPSSSNSSNPEKKAPLKGNNPDNVASQPKNILKAVSLEDADLIDTSGTRNVLLAKMDKQDKHDEKVDDNVPSDNEEGKIPNNDDCEWEEHANIPQGTHEEANHDLSEDHISPKIDEKVMKDDPVLNPKSPGLEAHNSNGNSFSSGGPHLKSKHASHFSSAPPMPSRNRANKCKAIAKLCNKHKVSFLGIQKTHISNLDPFKAIGSPLTFTAS